MCETVRQNNTFSAAYISTTEVYVVARDLHLLLLVALLPHLPVVHSGVGELITATIQPGIGVAAGAAEATSEWSLAIMIITASGITMIITR